MTVKLYGDIIPDDYAWLYEFFHIDYIAPGQLRQALEALPEGETLVLEINSPGGDVFAGFEMYGIVRGSGRPTEAHIIARAASAATTLTSACDRVLASPVAQMMIHGPYTWDDDYINNSRARELSQFLDSIKAGILNGYQLKCGGKTSRKKLEDLMTQSTWLPAQEAIALGLADGLLDVPEDMSAMLLGSGTRGGVQNSAGGESIQELMARYEQAVRDGAKPAEGHPVAGAPAEDANGPAGGQDDWRMKARLAIERARM